MDATAPLMLRVTRAWQLPSGSGHPSMPWILPLVSFHSSTKPPEVGNKVVGVSIEEDEAPHVCLAAVEKVLPFHGAAHTMSLMMRDSTSATSACRFVASNSLSTSTIICCNLSIWAGSIPSRQAANLSVLYLSRRMLGSDDSTQLGIV